MVYAYISMTKVVNPTSWSDDNHPECNNNVACKEYTNKSSLSLALDIFKEVINSASSVTQTLSGEVADGQHKLIALAAALGNSSAVNPLVTQLTNGPLGGLHEKFVDFVLLRYI